MQARKTNPGDRRGRLTVTKEVDYIRGIGPRYEVVCDCGRIKVFNGRDLNHKKRYCSRQCPLLPPMPSRSDLIGKKFSRWTVVGTSEANGRKKGRYWSCICDCGAKGSVPTFKLTTGHSQSCGCLNIDALTKYTTDAERKSAQNRACKAYWRRNPSKGKAKKIRRIQHIKHATPSWLSDEHWKEMNEFYQGARRLTNEKGELHHVDHIIPLQGETVCGLHVPWNLQILNYHDNCRKSNKFSQAA